MARARYSIEQKASIVMEYCQTEKSMSDIRIKYGSMDLRVWSNNPQVRDYLSKQYGIDENRLDEMMEKKVQVNRERSIRNGRPGSLRRF